MENTTQSNEQTTTEAAPEISKAEVETPGEDKGGDAIEKTKVRAGRVIVRNIQFDLTEKHLKSKFQIYGKIQEVSVPPKPDSKGNRGFGFVEFENKETAQKAIDALNDKAWKGRTLALEFSVPKGSYEHRVGKVVEHTKLAREDAVLPKVLRDQKKEAQEVKAKEEQVKKEYEEKNAAKIKKQEKKKAKKQAAKSEDKKEFEDATESESLFVRNIGFDTNEAQFLAFMEKFGPVKSALLCKANEFNKSDEFGGEKQKSMHKGTGFVKFKTKAPAASLLELSRKVEEHLDEERRNSRLKKTVKKSLISSLTLLQNEIELNGRRLIVKSSVTKEEAGVLREKQQDELKRKKDETDKRNLGMAKEGLLNEVMWVHQEPPLSKVNLELRQRLHIAKEKALKASTNLYISTTRLQIRNLPRKEFAEAELKQLMRVVADEWAKTMTLPERKELWKNRKLIQHVKIMKDEQKTDTLTGDALPSGQAFVEFTDAALALFAVRYLNNMEIVPKKGLIADFSMEDQRALFKRKEKIERWRKIAKEQKEEVEAVTREEELIKKKYHSNEPLDLGKIGQEDEIMEEPETEKPKQNPKKDKQHHGKMGIKNIDNLDKLKQMLNDSVSRGMKQRIKRKIQKLDKSTKKEAPTAKEEQSETNQVTMSGMANPNAKATKAKLKELDKKPKLSAKEKIDNILKKRDQKLDSKKLGAKAYLTTDDHKIMKDQKNKKREDRRKRNKEDNDDEFDGLLSNYKSKVMKKIDQINKQGESGASFEEVLYSD